MEIALHVQHKDYGLTPIPIFPINSVFLDFVYYEFYKAHMRLIGDVISIKNE
jgi:hypothetical protein